eukprot:1460426-Rhodomonas_salina.2
MLGFWVNLHTAVLLAQSLTFSRLSFLPPFLLRTHPPSRPSPSRLVSVAPRLTVCVHDACSGCACSRTRNPAIQVLCTVLSPPEHATYNAMSIPN